MLDAEPDRYLGRIFLPDSHLCLVRGKLFMTSHYNNDQMFMSIAEQMGRILQRTAISTNIKERLDFSCALFGHDGGLVSKAPHIPGHLGAMLDGVQYQMWAIEINEGDCIVSNHPCAGGVHLPVYSQVTAFLVLPGEFTSCSQTRNLHGNLIYCLKCMVGYDIPLNQGCLAPIPVNIPKWSIIDPDYQISGHPQEPPCSSSTGGDGVLRKIPF
ncbi:unnamed protein product [Clavelina lepadiformis]|uniref:Hydantoinase B/oxoprolinase domain-containing protein n=1 Tax=Clavelina lepadiformis TaxID=159417 RepID=A0ABP0G5X4_CLALP